METFSYKNTILFPKLNNKTETIQNKIRVEKILKDTLKIYQDAISYVCEIVFQNWENIKMLDAKEKYNAVEHMIHNTKDNTAICDFDEKFPMFPSYFRRDVCSQSIGAVFSYYTNKEKYDLEKYQTVSNGKKFRKKAPTMNFQPNKMPTFYKNNMYIPFADTNEVQLKLYVNKEWVYIPILLQERDLKYIKNLNGKLKNPVLDYSYGRFHLRYAVELPSKINKLPELQDRKIMSVDLGINSDAVCSIMLSDGTIIAREFISFTTEKAELSTLINRKKRKQRESGNLKFAKQKKIDKKIQGVNDNLSAQIAHKILETAIKYHVDVIVLEHLSTFKGKKGAKIHYWRKKGIINIICRKAHLYGIHYATINPRNTSKLAFDGSGIVTRNKNNYALCTFTTGKRYNCDLSASYNIGARYFLREYVNQFPDLKDLLPKATSRIYSDLIYLSQTRNRNVSVV